MEQCNSMQDFMTINSKYIFDKHAVCRKIALIN